jgi:hypothetical protein
MLLLPLPLVLVLMHAHQGIDEFDVVRDDNHTTVLEGSERVCQSCQRVVVEIIRRLIQSKKVGL